MSQLLLVEPPWPGMDLSMIWMAKSSSNANGTWSSKTTCYSRVGGVITADERQTSEGGWLSSGTNIAGVQKIHVARPVITSVCYCCC